MKPTNLRDPILITVGAAPSIDIRGIGDLLRAAGIEFESGPLKTAVDELVEGDYIRDERFVRDCREWHTYSLTTRGEALKQLLAYARDTDPPDIGGTPEYAAHCPGCGKPLLCFKCPRHYIGGGVGHCRDPEQDCPLCESCTKAEPVGPACEPLGGKCACPEGPCTSVGDKSRALKNGKCVHHRANPGAVPCTPFPEEAPTTSCDDKTCHGRGLCDRTEKTA